MPSNCNNTSYYMLSNMNDLLPGMVLNKSFKFGASTNNRNLKQPVEISSFQLQPGRVQSTAPTRGSTNHTISISSSANQSNHLLPGMVVGNSFTFGGRTTAAASTNYRKPSSHAQGISSSENKASALPPGMMVGNSFKFGGRTAGIPVYHFDQTDSSTNVLLGGSGKEDVTQFTEYVIIKYLSSLSVNDNNVSLLALMILVAWTATISVAKMTMKLRMRKILAWKSKEVGTRHPVKRF